jgi:type II secretory ATPase GspE/PulE/Tfp pilus assembly ATPase PilB-like protein
MKPQQPALLGQVLVEKKIITPEQLELALKKQKESGEPLGIALLKLGFVDEENYFLPIVASQLGVDFVNLSQIEISKEVINKIPAKIATYYKLIPIDFSNGVLTIATASPLDVNIIDGVSLVVKEKIKTALASEKDILECISTYYGVGAQTIDQMMETNQIKPTLKKNEDLAELDNEASIAKFLNQVLIEAYEDRATDIHIEPYENDLKIRYRIDGVLSDTKLPANINHFKDFINARIKIMSNLNIAEKRLPQDGRFKVKIGSANLDLRVSFLPTQFGESVVIRLLRSSSLYSLSDLGLTSDDLKTLDLLLKKPHGIIFVTGPTGSGKTTTLYACLSHINSADNKIITIEDPIEYQLKGIMQMQIHPEIGLTFARGLRSMLRHDPDVMMVGEVRDAETAKTAVQIAMTGHLIFSTLHTNDSASGVTRLIDMGIDPYLITSSVECFIAQRLVRELCPRCKTPFKTTAETIKKNFGIDPQIDGEITLYENIGCKACNSSGYHGRSGIYEFLILNDEIREMIMQKASSTQIKNKAMSLGMITLMQSGWNKVKEGSTTMSEIVRVTKEDTK